MSWVANSNPEEIKIKKVWESEICPIIWIGEKTPPRVEGVGRLVKVETENYPRKMIYGVRRIVKFNREFEPDIPNKYIVMGGVPPQVVEVVDIVEIHDRYEDISEIGNILLAHKIGKLLIASGIGNKSWGLLVSQKIEPNNELLSFRGVIYNPPERWRIEWEEPRGIMKLLFP